MPGTRIGGDIKQATVAALNVVWPAGVQAGDIAVVFSGHSNASTTTTPTGFTSIKTTATNAAFGECFVKVCTGSETGNLAVNISTASKHEAELAVWRGVVAPVAADVTIQLGTADASTSSAVPAVTTTSTPTWWLTHTIQANSTPPTSFTEPSGTTKVGDAINTGSGAKCGSGAFSNASETDGSVGAGTWTRVGGSGNIDWANFTVALKESTVRIVKTQSTTWNTNARVAKTQGTTWQVRARLAKTQATSWAVLARVIKTQATSWDVAGSLTRIVKTISTTWNTNARVVKTQSTTWDVAGTLARIVKTISTTWNVRARVVKTQGTTWTVRSRIAKTLATTWNVASMISEANWPAFIGHRGTDPGPEETMFAYDALYARSPNYWHEGDGQALSDGTTMVANHDDDVDRMYSSGPVATGLVTAISPANWALEKWRPNTGFTGPDQFALKLSDWVAKYGFNPTTGPAIGLWEVKPGTSAAQMAATFVNCKGTVILNCNSLVDAQTARAAGFDACLQTDTPVFSQFTANGIKYLSINFTAMTGTIASQAIAAGVKVLMYTVNSTANRDSMLALFSDTSYAGFISNKPQTIAGTTRIAKTQSTTWVVRARVAKTQATTWVVRARVAKTQGTTWQVRQRVVKTISTTWDVAAGVVSASRAKVWNGTAWVAKPVKVGVTWLTKTLKARSGGGTWI